MDIVTYAKKVLGKKLFNYEAKILRDYEELRTHASFHAYLAPKNRCNRYLYDIWLSYKDYQAAGGLDEQ